MCTAIRIVVSGETYIGKSRSNTTHSRIIGSPTWNRPGQVDRLSDRTQKLWLLEEINKLRNRDVAWWAWFHRVKAQLHETLAQQARFDAMPLLRKAIDEKTVEGFALIRAYYVLGDYNRQMGKKELALELWHEAAGVQWTDGDGVKRTGNTYINELIEERKKLIKEP